MMIFALYVLLRVRRTEARDVVLLATLCAFSWGLGEFIMRAYSDPKIAEIGSRVFLTAGVGLLGPTSLYMVMLITAKVKPFRGISLFLAFYWIPIWVIIIRAGTDWIQTGVKLYAWGYSDDLGGPLGTPYYIFTASYFFLALALLARRFQTSEGKNKQIALLMFIGLVIPLILTISTDVIIPTIGGHVPEMAVPACVIYLVALFVCLDKYELFEIKPVSEKRSEAEHKTSTKDKDMIKDLPGGKMYYFSESKPETSLKVFTSLVSQGRQGLGIIRISPQKFRELTGLEKTPVIWLSSQEGQTIKTINPSAISRIYVTIADFLKTAERPVIMLEGIEALIFTNNFREVMGFISSVYEKVSVSEGVIIVPISKSTMNEAEWTLLTRHMDDLALLMAGPEDA